MLTDIEKFSSKTDLRLEANWEISEKLYRVTLEMAKRIDIHRRHFNH